MRAFNAVLLMVLLCSTSACFSLFGDPHFEEIARAKSPDGVVDAVLVRGNRGATTPYTFSAFLVPSGTAFDQKSPWFEAQRALFTTDHQEGLELSWRVAKFLEIRYAKGRIYRFTNFWQAREVQDFTYVVELRLVPTDEA
jgi:hypothetical protein